MSLGFIALFLFVSNSLLDTGHLHFFQHFVYTTDIDKAGSFLNLFWIMIRFYLNTGKISGESE